MAYQHGDRKQRALFPQSIDEYIPQEAPARAYDAFVDSLDFDELGIDLDAHKIGCPQYDPKSMLKLLVYGYSYGIRSSRGRNQTVADRMSMWTQARFLGCGWCAIQSCRGAKAVVQMSKM